MRMTETLAPFLPHLRRYARALSGSQTCGDAYVRAALSALVNGKSALPTGMAPKVGLYHVFHMAWLDACGEVSGQASPVSQLPAERRLNALSSSVRAALLLTAVEGFEIADAAEILGETTEEVEHAIVEAQHAIERQLASRVLIIEDESIIALDLEGMVTRLGHEVVALAATKDEAVAKARVGRPGLILADINLGEGGSGTEAVTEILARFDVPVIFITAYPERLLTGTRPEPTYLVTKPFLPETVQATIGQALFFHVAKSQAA
nr:MAG: response regulator [Hyphomicrobiales bacterium]